MKKIVSIILCLAMIFTMPISTYAISNDEPISTFGQSKPSKSWDWNKGEYNFIGEANTSALYSNYSFTDANKLYIRVRNHHASKTLTVKLLKSQAGIDFSVSTMEIKPTNYAEWSVSVDSSRTYILKFSAPSDFSGEISDQPFD